MFGNLEGFIWTKNNVYNFSKISLIFWIFDFQSWTIGIVYFGKLEKIWKKWKDFRKLERLKKIQMENCKEFRQIGTIIGKLESKLDFRKCIYKSLDLWKIRKIYGKLDFHVFPHWISLDIFEKWKDFVAFSS